MSVGHLARIFEAGGITTVIVAALPFRARLEAMAVPRLLLTPYPMSRVFGRPGDQAGQRAAVEAALDLLESAGPGMAVRELEGAG